MPKRSSPLCRDEDELPEPLPKKQKVTSKKEVVAEKKKTTEASAPSSPVPVAQQELRSKRKHDATRETAPSASALQQHVSCR